MLWCPSLWFSLLLVFYFIFVFPFSTSHESFSSAQLLYARKKDNPCGKWLQRLPLKARMLENQLYKNAASLEAYFDRSTLKGRLGKLASAITSHYKQAMERRGSSGNSTTSNPSEGNSTTSNPSIPFLGYGEDAFAETKLRRLSSESMPSSKASSVPPISGASDSAVMRGGQSNSGSAAKRSLAAISGPLHPLSEIPDGKDSSRGKKNKTTLRGNTSTNNPLLETLSSNNNMMLNAGGRIPQWAAMNNMMMGGGMNNSMNSGMSNAMNNAMGGGMGNGVGGGMGNGVGGGMGNGVGSGMNNAMGGGMNNGMMALHQLQHQQRALMMQQQQQQQNMSGMSMANLVALQQQQQQQIPNGAMSMANANSGMNMVNMSALPNVIPGGGGSFPSFPMNNGNNASMPPPQALNGMGAPGSGNASNDATSPLSPGSFHW
jgi:hypothetical protein